jgi:AraC-like DNA-binding protein
MSPSLASAPTRSDAWTAVRRYDALELGLLRHGRAARLDASGPDHGEWPLLGIYAPAGGGRLVGEAGNVRVERGGLCLLPVSETTIYAVDGELLVLRLRRSTVDLHRGVLEQSVWRPWATDNGTASLVAHLLDGLLAQLEAYQPADPGRLAQHLIGFIAMMCTDASADSMDDVRRRLLDRAKQDIESRLGDVDLTPAAVAQRLSVSTRTLHRLFEADGTTIGGWTRHRRLEHCRAELETAPAHLPVSSIGARWGLWDAAHFSKAFKAAYGMPPVEYRSRARRDAPATAMVDSASGWWANA